MEINEFVNAIERLEIYYGKEYDKRQLQIMFEELKDIPIVRFKQLVSQSIKRCKFLPKVADFIQLEKEVLYIDNKHEEQEKIDCKKCNGTGYIIYTKRVNNGDKSFEYSYAAICDCRNSKQYKGWEIQGNNKSDYYTPMAKELNLI